MLVAVRGVCIVCGFWVLAVVGFAGVSLFLCVVCVDGFVGFVGLFAVEALVLPPLFVCTFVF